MKLIRRTVMKLLLLVVDSITSSIVVQLSTLYPQHTPPTTADYAVCIMRSLVFTIRLTNVYVMYTNETIIDRRKQPKGTTRALYRVSRQLSHALK